MENGGLKKLKEFYDRKQSEYRKEYKSNHVDYNRIRQYNTIFNLVTALEYSLDRKALHSPVVRHGPAQAQLTSHRVGTASWVAPPAQARLTSSRAMPCRPEDMGGPSCLFF